MYCASKIDYLFSLVAKYLTGDPTDFFFYSRHKSSSSSSIFTLLPAAKFYSVSPFIQLTRQDNQCQFIKSIL